MTTATTPDERPAELKHAEVRTVPLSALKAAKYNPRGIDAEALDALEASMDQFGIVEPIVWNERSGNIVGGHQRFKILKRRKVRETPVMVVDLNDVDEKALNLALNSPTLQGKFRPNLQVLLDEIKDERGSLFEQLRFEGLTWEEVKEKRKVAFEATVKEIRPGARFEVVVTLDDEDAQKALHKRLKAEGYKVASRVNESHLG